MAKTPLEIKSLARAHTTNALNVLQAVMMQETAPHSARVAAAEALLNRGWGKPAQAHTGEDGEGPIEHAGKIELVIIDPSEIKA